MQNIFIKKYIPGVILVRIALLTPGLTYAGAVDMLKNTFVTSSIYYIVAGIDSGCVIEKEDIGYKGFWEISPSSKDWYIV